MEYKSPTERKDGNAVQLLSKQKPKKRLKLLKKKDT